MASYIDKLDKQLRQMGVRGNKYIMQSNSGTTTFEQSKETPINTVELGRVAGIFGAAMLGKILGAENIIAFDIGGTTAKCSLIVVRLIKATGGGYGSPHKRPAEKVAGDAKNGYISVEQAKEIYGVNLDTKTFDITGVVPERQSV